MEIKPMTLEDAFALYDEEPSGDIVIQAIDNPETVYEDENED